MQPPTRVAFILIAFAPIVSACARTGNDERAYVVKQGARYVVEMKGRRRVLAHDPISALRGRTYDETFTIELPRVDGVIDASEITVPATLRHYTGRVAITDRKMTVDLYDDNGTDRTKFPLRWNGEYTLTGYPF
jgi:hypothetical protein